jgi:hypothetical protein
MATTVANRNGRATALGPVTEAANEDIAAGTPYRALVAIRGTADLLFHAWNCEAVEKKANADKGSKEKKTDNVESYVWRDESGHICLPGVYLRGAVVNAAKFRQDPRSPRKSAMDLFKAAVVPLTELAPIGQGVADWEYDHRCRVMVQRNGVTRTRPAFKAGWTAELVLMVMLPQYVPPALLHDVIVDAGKFVGVGDFRPTYGRFAVDRFQVLSD